MHDTYGYLDRNLGIRENYQVIIKPAKKETDRTEISELFIMGMDMGMDL